MGLAAYRRVSDFLRDWYCGMIIDMSHRTLPLRILEDGQRRGVTWRAGTTVAHQVSDCKKVIQYLLDKAGVRAGHPSIHALHTACEQLQESFEALPKGKSKSLCAVPKLCFSEFSFCSATFEREALGWPLISCRKQGCICKAAPSEGGAADALAHEA